MKRFLTLIKLEIKKSLKALPKLLTGTLLLILTVTAIALTANNLLGKSEESESSEKSESSEAFVDIGVVCMDDSWIMDIAKGMLLGNKKITGVVNFEFTDYDKAMEALSDNEYMAVVIIPENAVDDIISGDNTPFQVIFPKNAGYEAAAIREVADSAVKLLASAQAGVYSVYDFYGAHNKRLYRAAATARLNERYIEAVLELEDFFKDTTVVATGSLDIMEYYTLSGIILFIMLFGMNTITFRESYKKEIVTALSQSGTGTLKQTAAGFLGILSVYGVICVFLTAVLCVFADLGIWLTIKLLLGMLPVIMTASAMVLLVQTLIKYKPAAIMAMFLVSVFQSFVTGGFIPQIMLPKVIEAIGKLTPAYYMLKEISAIYLNSSGILLNTIILLLITAALLALTALMQRCRVNYSAKR